MRLLVFGLPVALWVAVLYAGSSSLGRFANSAYALQAALHLLAPEYPLELDHNGFLIQVNLFILNAAVRRLTHIFAYAVLTCLVVRWIQGGAERLKRASLLGAFGVSLLYVGVDAWHLSHVPERHFDASDLLLNLIGVFLVLTGTVVWFGLKSWERRLLAEETAPGG